ncbi:MAG: M1 family aminopeptidase [Bacteroidota bacterium]
MWFKIFLFELKYRSKRPATYIYFGVLAFVSLMAISTDSIQVGGGTGLVKENAPATIATMMVILSAFMMMITSAIMGVGILRDFEHRIESLVFSTPIKKWDYLFGRFLGSYVTTLFVFSGLLFGFTLGEFMPWRDADKLLPFDFWHYLHPFIYIVVPNLLFSGILFFFTGALSRKMVMVYVQWIVLFAIYQIAAILFGEVDNRNLSGLLDPFGFYTINNTTQYWTVAEQNSLTIPIEGMVLMNRLLWLGVGLVFFVVGYFAFKFDVVRGGLIKKKARKTEKTSNTLVKIPFVTSYYGFTTSLLQIWRQAIFYFKYIIRSIPFIAIFLFGFFILVVNSFFIGEVFGTYTYPTTYLMLELITGAFGLFFLIILVFYSGELVWRERDVKINQIQDALPVSDSVGLLSKFLSMVMVFIVLILFLIFSGVVIQTFKGYHEYNLGVYFTTMFTETLSYVVLFTLLAFFIQVMVNNKFLGHAIMIIFFISMQVMDNWGLEHGLFQFGSISLGRYSEMNGYGHFFQAFNWFDLYWFAFVLFLFAVSVVFAVRGAESAMKWRWKVGKLRLGRPLLIFGIVSLMVFGLSGCYIYYNTNVLNAYQNSDDQNAHLAAYEKTLKQYEFLPHPKVTAIDVKVEIYPETRDYSIEGVYTLKNLYDEPIETIHVQLDQDKNTKHEYVTFDRETLIEKSYDKFRYYIYKLSQPLAPGDSTIVSFKMEYVTEGFKESGSNTGIVYNGSFINNSTFPGLGYNEGLELTSDDDREENGLEPKERLMKRDNPLGLSRDFFTDDSHGVDFQITVGTVSDQTAIAPGYLQKEWEENGRRYFRYKMDQEMVPFFNVVSARYEVIKDQTFIQVDSTEKEIDLAIYYHKGHEYNLESMMKGMKHSLTYFSRAFSPYQYRQMRILEFPRYATFAQSFANTVPFSESIGFMIQLDDDDDVDVTYFVTAHELAHQWWGHQLRGANVQGGVALSEALAQYSALMVMKNEYPQEHIKEFLKEELDRYLTGRTLEQKKEMPLSLVENQQYIHYGKGASVMYALQDYVSEDSVNAALKRFIGKWGTNTFNKNGRYPTTIDLLEYLGDVTPDSLQYVLTDFFDRIVLFENKIDEASYADLGDGTYEVTLDIDTKKMVADSLGASVEEPIRYWIDVGVYAEVEDEEQLIYLKKHLFDKNETTLKVTVDQKPISAGIDPLNKLIDRNPDDNTKKVSLKTES